ncbi:MAG TPA: nuclear transport factor 2 family protein [Saprospiraceae bacterium]|nr:nuclear transport factor 2 family protein [Saprospiraceae bacterium]
MNYQKWIITLTLILPTMIIFGQKKQITQLENSVEALRQAMIQPDKNKLDVIVMEELSYGHSNGRIEDKDTFIRNLLNGNSNFEEIILSDQQITVNKKTAIVRHQLFARTNDKSKGPGEVNLHIMTVWVKRGGSWKLLARQAVKKV